MYKYTSDPVACGDQSTNICTDCISSHLNIYRNCAALNKTVSYSPVTLNEFGKAAFNALLAQECPIQSIDSTG